MLFYDFKKMFLGIILTFVLFKGLNDYALAGLPYGS